MITEALELAVTADVHVAASLDELGVLRSEAREGEFVFARLYAAATCAGVDNVVGDETADLGVVMHLSSLVEVVLRPRATIGHDQGWRVEHAGTRPELDDVVEKRRDGQAVLIAVEAVDRVREVELHIQRALGGGHYAFLFAGHHHPLPLLAVADEIGLEIGGAVKFAVAANDVVGVIERLEIGVGEYTRTGGVRAGAEDLAGADQVLVSKCVVGAGLRIKPGTMVFPETSITFALEGTETVPRLPTATMRLSLTTTSASSSTSSPRMVCTIGELLQRGRQMPRESSRGNPV